MSPVRYELGFCIPENDTLHSHRSEKLNLTLSFPFLSSPHNIYIISSTLSSFLFPHTFSHLISSSQLFVIFIN
jgi:hypothetical protein